MGDDGISFESAKLNPSAAFRTPEKVADYPAFTLDQKIEILRRWAYDANELSVAEEEGMGAGEPSLTDRVYKELNRLTGGFRSDISPPTKHGGVPRSRLS